MTTEPHNPFVLPGFGQTGDMAGNPVMASMEMMRKAWQGLAGHGSFGTPSMAASMSVEDLERRISDLRAVENWLRMNLTVLSNTIQGLEVQRATISTLKNFVATASAGIPSGQDSGSPLETLLGIRPSARTQAASAQAPAAAPAADDARAPQADAGAAAEPGDAAAALGAMFDSDKAVAATQAWWGLLQKQFDSLAAATAATMQPAAGAAAAPAGAEGDRAKATATGKTRARAAAAPSAAAKPARKPRAAKTTTRTGATRSGGR